MTIEEAIYSLIKTVIDNGPPARRAGAYSPFYQDDHPATCTLVGMAADDDRAKTEITEPPLDEHADIRRWFVQLWNERTSDTGAIALDAAWLATLSTYLVATSASPKRVAVPEYCSHRAETLRTSATPTTSPVS